ncbi:MAG: Ribosomal protein L31 (Modular protein) [Candidatus Woesebacteria bacterium GW2011_GWB1_39_12]|uniref:Large ribosomal subunit protein bL31 n=2 Tax=Candidatus Woeseibacteriota TaxID=1752722 RepID=A0A0G0M2T8_9BACT|nr:MAG: Ribosomal protein L31 (Modular protein) [Candidatus Woesebacteria bacterium GW2011_GWA1_39_12]KKR00705.1 MAG: Ribosomal protein L31 (Modular protein) [Candidatus Woesebacteria bacterium GW2011_GWB1_39_12]
MKANIHPEWFPEAQVTCACGNTFKVGSTLPKIEVEVCYNCHPFYTGQMKYVDTAGRVDSFEARRKMAVEERVSKTEKRMLRRERKIQKELERPDTLAELRKISKKKN